MSAPHRARRRERQDEQGVEWDPFDASFLPPLFKDLPVPRPEPSREQEPSAWRRLFKSPVSRRTLQEELDTLEHEEEHAVLRSNAIRQLGWSWLVPLGRTSTAEEDAESDTSMSPTPAGSPEGGMANGEMDTTGDDGTQGGAGQGSDAGTADESGAGHGGAGGGGAAPEDHAIDLDDEIENADTTRDSDDDDEDEDTEGESSMEDAQDLDAEIVDASDDEGMQSASSS